MSPLYEYRCEDCSEVREEVRSYEERNEPCECRCGGTMQYIISAPCFVADTTPSTTQAKLKERAHQHTRKERDKLVSKFGRAYQDSIHQGGLKRKGT